MTPGRGGRERHRRDYPSRYEERSSSGRSNAPPSRHLWVGNLSHSIVESDLTYHFLRFGELDSVAFQPGRSYAFINFKFEEEAIAAMRALQGFHLAGNPLRIEFAKADKSATPSHDEDYLQRRDEQRSTLRGSPFSQREPRARPVSPDLFYPDKSRISDNSAEPSEVLWIGFPASLKVDEMILRKAFSPFGEIEKVTAFPGRSYAFVRFRSVMSACRAKETLQGKLFGNPRVHICFAKSEAGSSNSGRGSINAPLSPHFKLNGRPGPPENLRPDRNFGRLAGDPDIISPHFLPDLDPVDSDAYSFSKKDTLRSSERNSYEHWRFGEVGSEQDIYERHISPAGDRDTHLHDFSQKFPLRGPFFEEPWDLPEDAHYFHEAKKLKTSPFPPDKDLPEYPFSDVEQERRAFPKAFPDFPHPELFEKNFEVSSFGYKQIAENTANLTLPHGERRDNWKGSYDNIPTGSGSLPSNHVETKRFTPESGQSSLKEWKWEGTIAKGGTPVCRARCFPVGKVLDIMLPEFLDCTARTSLDMLAKHYYQATGAWVVFFVPGSDADMGLYNEFMHYLEDKQRAAVAKLDDKNTLFLVPPSDFSQNVLKVPGKLSISGVVLRLEHPGSSFGSLHHPNDNQDANLLSFKSRDTLYPKPQMPPVPFPSMMSYPDSSKSGSRDLSFSGNPPVSIPPTSLSVSAFATGNMSDSYNENRLERLVSQQNPPLGPNWSPHHLQNSVSGTRNMPSQMPNTMVDLPQEHYSVMPRLVQETSSNHSGGRSAIPFSAISKSSLQEPKPSPGSLSVPVTGLQPEQLAQLASSLIGQRRQTANMPAVTMGANYTQPNLPEDAYRPSQTYALPKYEVMPENSAPQLQILQRQQSNVVPSTVQREVPTGAQGNQLLQNTGTQEEEADPQKRLQATLQLAAALLQQIQQGKGT